MARTFLGGSIESMPMVNTHLSLAIMKNRNQIGGTMMPPFFLLAITDTQCAMMMDLATRTQIGIYFFSMEQTLN
jgi:hypothetical protein